MSVDTTAVHDPLHGPEHAQHTSPPPLDIAVGQARQVLAQRANANIHNHAAMMLAATELDYVLRDVLAALDKEAGR